MNIKLKKKVAVAVILAMLSGTTTVFADTLSSQLKKQKSVLQQNESLLKDAQDKSDELESQIEEMDVQIETLYDQIDSNKKEITKTEADIKDAEVRVKKAQDDVDLQQNLLGKRVRAMYKSGLSSYLSILLEAKSMSDLVSRYEIVRKLIEFDKKTIHTLEAEKEQLAQDKAKLDEKRNGLLALKSSNEQKLGTIKDSMAGQQKLIAAAKEQEKTYASKVSYAQSLVNITLTQIAAIRKATPRYNPSRGAVAISDNAVLAYASNFLGTPYVWGGTTPNPGFDCSGFTRYVYAHFGVSLGRTTWDQINDGVGVSRDNLEPGDLVLFGRGGNPTHVGIYAGNNTYIQAPRTGDVVKISPMTRSDFITGRRVK